MDVIQIQADHYLANQVKRSSPPEVPAPPTLHPEPLMLSPLHELPYLFALELPAVAGELLAQRKQEEKEGGNKGQQQRPSRVSKPCVSVLGLYVVSVGMHVQVQGRGVHAQSVGVPTTSSMPHPLTRHSVKHAPCLPALPAVSARSAEQRHG